MLPLHGEDLNGVAEVSSTGRGAEREADDYYTTPSWAVRRLLESWTPPAGVLAEPSAGNGAIIRAAEQCGIRTSRWHAFEIREEESARLSDLCTTQIQDFLRAGADPVVDVGAVIGNPPFSHAFEFILEARRRFPVAQVCYLLRVAFAASEDRNPFMRDNPPDVYLLPNRPSFTGQGTDSADYAWFIWHPVQGRSSGSFRVLAHTPLEERKRDRGHEVLIPDRQIGLFA